MKFNKAVLALLGISLFTMVACGGNPEGASSEVSSQTISSEPAKTAMGFLADDSFRLDVASAVQGVSFEMNGKALSGASSTDKLNGSFKLTSTGNANAPLYITVAKSEGGEHIAAKVYGSIPADQLNTTLDIICDGKAPNKVYIAISTEKRYWVKNLDQQMDQEIVFAWEFIG